MKLPNHLCDKTEWALIGPMGPEFPAFLKHLPTIAVDGGANFIKSADLWIGDGDSSKLPGVSASAFHLPAMKDKSDLACALEFFSDKTNYQLHLWGFSGGRKDHELFVLGECMSFLAPRAGSRITLYSHNKISFELLSAGSWVRSQQGLFSLGTLTEAKVKLTGAIKYPIEHPSLISPLSSFGLSNQADGEFTLTNDKPVFIYFPEEK